MHTYRTSTDMIIEDPADQRQWLCRLGTHKMELLIVIIVYYLKWS